MVRRKSFKDPEDLFECCSYVFKDDRGLTLISLPPNLIEKLGIKEGDGFIWLDYYPDSNSETIIRAKLSRRSYYFKEASNGSR